MNRDRTIDYIEFPATNLTVTKIFYEKVFGWEFEDYGPEYTSFKDGRLAGGFKKGQPSRTGALIVIYVADLPDAEQRVKAAGGKITTETFSFPGGSRFHFTDPNGNELAVWHEA
jgi:uncharacterized protein